MNSLSRYVLLIGPFAGALALGCSSSDAPASGTTLPTILAPNVTVLEDAFHHPNNRERR